MRSLSPELKRIKAETKGNKQKESQMIMELYKEKGVSPFGSIGMLIVQLPILIGLYAGIRKVVNDPHAIVNFAYPGLQHLGWMKMVAHNIHLFDATLFGVVDLTRAGLGKAGGIYLPAMIIVTGSAIVQYLQSGQLLPSDKDSKGLKAILKDASAGKQADQTEVNAAVGRSTKFLLPVMIFFLTAGLASALSLYWFVGGLVAYGQQALVLNKDEEEMEIIADKPNSNAKERAAKAVEAEVVEKKVPKSKKPSSKKK
jgi:YidC/Oxa1 family membrane protein insertase